MSLQRRAHQQKVDARRQSLGKPSQLPPAGCAQPHLAHPVAEGDFMR
eukprot:gene44644-3460_t